MAVRVTAGRITIAATLAVVLSVVSLFLEDAGPKQQANVFLNCFTCYNGCGGYDPGLNDPVLGQEGNPTVCVDPMHPGSVSSPTCTDFACQEQGFYPDLQTCIDECHIETGWCGNGNVDSGEQCDNGSGNGTPGNPCSVSCTNVASSSSASSTSNVSSSSVAPVASSSAPSTASSSSTSTSTSSSTSSTSSSSSTSSISSSSTSSTSSSVSSSSSTSSTSSSASSSSSASCGDGVVQETGPGPDGVAGNSDDMEQCDDGNSIDSDACTNACTTPKCGDGIPGNTPGEQCDILDADGNLDINEGCKPDCTWTQCADQMVDNDGDGQADGGDGGCTVQMCNPGSGHNKADDDEWNPCAKGEAPSGYPFPYGQSVPQGGQCEYDNECAGYSGQGGAVRCGSNGCVDLSSYNAGEPGSNGLTAQAGAGGFNPPLCPPDNCGGQVVGFPDECPGGEDGDTCAAQTTRQACLLQSALKPRPGKPKGQCPNGQIVATAAPGQWSCSQGVGAAQQWMCGPVGQWKCVCPNDPPPPPAPFVPNLQLCPAACGNGRREQGEACDDGNQNNGDACSNACQPNGGGQCDGVDACGDPLAQAMCADDGKVCQADDQLPCMKCVEEVGGECSLENPDLLDECANGGNALAEEQDPPMDCSLTAEFPCITFVPENSCGNGEINPVEQQEVDEGCRVTGTSGQYCLPANMIPDDFGIWQPSHECFLTAHCQSLGGGQCGWEQTQELEQCIQENGGDPAVWLPGDVQANAPSRLVGQVGEGGACNAVCSADMKPCFSDTCGITYVGRDHCNECAWKACPAGSSLTPPASCATACARGGCFGEICMRAADAQYTTPPFQCVYVQDVACYDNASCEWNGSSCAWRDTPELQECLADNADSTCPTDQTCKAECGVGETEGGECGADGLNVCCTGAIDVPVEECDDGNQVDGDACGNDCEVNCRVHADCPEGACVDGQCVDQCVPPDDGDDGNDDGGDGDGDGGEDDEVVGQCPASHPSCGTLNGASGAPAASCPNGTFLVWLQDGVLCDQGEGHGRCYGCFREDQAMHPAAEGGMWGQLMALTDAFNLLP